MAGKRLGDRAHHGPEEDRARKPSGDRKKKLRMRDTENEHGLSAKDEARMKAWHDAGH